MNGSLIPGGLGSGEMLMLPGVRILTATLPPEDIAALDPKTYSITIRFQDSKGDWSIPQSRSFTIPDVDDVLGVAQNIVRGEYFILSDSESLVPPALGTGTAFNLPSPINGVIDLSAVIPGSAFPADAEGIYYVGVRFQDDADNWSFT